MAIDSQRVLFQWPDDTRIDRSKYSVEAAKAIIRDLSRTHPSDLNQYRDELGRFEALLIGLISRTLRRSPVRTLRWTRVLTLLERTLSDLPRRITPVLSGIRGLEKAIAAASADLETASHDATQTWDIEGMSLVLLSRRRLPPQRMMRFAQDLMDLKFKLFCITCADVPTYAARIRALPKNSAAAKLLALSFDGLLAFKCRAVWETVMNMTYHLETGRDAEAQWGKNKSKHWWAWVRTDPHWRGLHKFRRDIERFDHLLRTPEAHQASTLRAKFARDRSPRRHRQLANQLINVSIGIWAHTGMVLTIGQGVTYAGGRQSVRPRKRSGRADNTRP